MRHERQPGGGGAPAPADRGLPARSASAPASGPPGERLPSIPALAEAYGVAKQTVQRTIDQLRVEGLLITRPGSGTYVRGTRRRLNRLSRGRYGARRGYHADLAARYRQQLTRGRRHARPARGRRRVRGPRRHRRCWSAATWSAPTSSSRSRSARPGSCPADAAGTVAGASRAAFGRPLYQEVEDETGRRYAHRHRPAQRPPAHPRRGRAASDPARHPGAAPAARRLRRASTGRSRWPRRPGPAR